MRPEMKSETESGNRSRAQSKNVISFVQDFMYMLEDYCVFLLDYLRPELSQHQSHSWTDINEYAQSHVFKKDYTPSHTHRHKAMFLIAY